MNTQKLFNNSVLNKLTSTDSIFVIRIYLVICVGICVYGFIKMQSGVFWNLFYLIIGLLLFTLLEYIMHRFLYHSGENYLDDKNWQYKIHGVHHSYPKDKDRLAMPLPLALLLSIGFFFLFYIVVGNYVYFFFPGFLLGYTTYLFIHYKIHTRKPPKNVFKNLWIHHLRHHHLHDDKAFGVSSPLWDYIFNTMPNNKKSSLINTNH